MGSQFEKNKLFDNSREIIKRDDIARIKSKQKDRQEAV